MQIGDNVIVKDPRPNDLWNHSFVGTVVDIQDESGVISVMDQDENVFDMDADQARLDDGSADEEED
jgi:hypothetical protein